MKYKEEVKQKLFLKAAKENNLPKVLVFAFFIRVRYLELSEYDIGSSNSFADNKNSSNNIYKINKKVKV